MADRRANARLSGCIAHPVTPLPVVAAGQEVLAHPSGRRQVLRQEIKQREKWEILSSQCLVLKKLMLMFYIECRTNSEFTL